MPVFQITVDINEDKRVSYYAKCKNINKYISVAKCKSKKLNNDNIDIYNIVGGAFGDYQVNEIKNQRLSDKDLCSELINNDVNCINKYKLNFKKSDYDKKYKQKCQNLKNDKVEFPYNNGKFKFRTLADLGKHYDEMMEDYKNAGPGEFDWAKWKIKHEDCWYSDKDAYQEYLDSRSNSSDDY